MGIRTLCAINEMLCLARRHGGAHVLEVSLDTCGCVHQVFGLCDFACGSDEENESMSIVCDQRRAAMTLGLYMDVHVTDLCCGT